MATRRAAPVRFAVAGQVQGDVVQLSAQRAAGAVHTLQAQPGESVVALQIENGPRLLLHPQSAADLIAAQHGAAPARGKALQVPAQLGWSGLESATPARGTQRGWLGSVVLQSLQVIGVKPLDHAATLATAAVTQHLDGRVHAGVYALQADALAQLNSATPLATLPPRDAPQLVLVHGTFVDTHSTFGPLWLQHPQHVRQLFDRYAGAVYALDHPTLGVSPIANALTLAQALPDGARLHLVTHSRGGLVAEVLARACADSGFDEATLARHFRGDYAHHADELRALRRQLQGRAIRVERIVRVACPARGTLLASRRLDAYLSVIQWLLAGSGMPVLPELIAFLHEVARRRADPAELPGLEAMMPGSPLVAWLNEAAVPLPGGLRVIAGDMQGDSLTSWLKTLLADAFYWTDNDLVVQTRSMYGGTPRASDDAPLYLLDRGGAVNHFHYFSNERTAQAVLDGLQQDAPAGFAAIGPLSWSGADASGARGLLRAPASQPERPCVLLLPGLLGTTLAVDGRTVWISWRLVNGLPQLAWGAPGVAPEAPLGMSYDALIAHLSATHEVLAFGFDWRAPLQSEAQRLAQAIDAALDARAASGQPVRLLAHSMGGLLARTLALEAPATWQRLIAHPDARLLMLGTPNAGSWAPMQALSGDDVFTDAVLAVGALLQDHRGRQILAEMPGLIQLQAGLLDNATGLAQQATWQRLADDDLAIVRRYNTWHQDERQLNPYRWGVPPQPLLDGAVALQRRLAAQALPADKLLLVVGHDRFTPDGFRVDADTGVEYLNAEHGGDGRVTIDSARLPGVATWSVDAPHAQLPATAEAFAAYEELLRTGRTTLLPALPMAIAPLRAARAPGAPPQRSASRPSRSGHFGQEAPAPSLEALFNTPAQGPTPPAPLPLPALALLVRNADLRTVREPLLLGHYRASRLTGTEAVVDRRLGGALQQALHAGLYPTETGTPQVFMPGAGAAADGLAAAIVVGLGEEGKLSLGDLQSAARQGAIAYAQRQAERAGHTGFTLAATLMGSGGSGISAGNAAQAIAQGVREANAHLQASGWPLVQRLVLVELYLDRATEAWIALDVLRDAAPAALQLADAIEPGTGALRRPLDTGYRGVHYDFVIAVGRPQAGGTTLIEYTLDTRRARSEVRGQATQATLVHELVAAAADERTPRPELGSALFQLLVPRALQPFLVGSRETVLELDEHTAAIPWELLDARNEGDALLPGTPPWAVRCKLLRKLRTQVFREQPLDAGRDGGRLVIGEPAIDDPNYPPLPGARAEALAVAAVLGVPALLGANALAIIDALLGAPYRVVHVAGHGVYTPQGSGGVVLSSGAVLGPREIENMQRVPELVFVNCCYLGKIEPTGSAGAGLARRRTEFAANVAEQLIRIGVRCVVAAGWAVDDDPAQLFATRFYQELQRGRRFADAAALAREAAWATHPHSITWAAYQCYGDPDWQLTEPAADLLPLAAAYKAPIVSAPALALALETLAVQAGFDGADLKAARDELRALENAHAKRWGTIGAVAEAFGVAYLAVGEPADARRWLQAAVSAQDRSASMAALDHLKAL